MRLILKTKWSHLEFAFKFSAMVMGACFALLPSKTTACTEMLQLMNRLTISPERRDQLRSVVPYYEWLKSSRVAIYRESQLNDSENTSIPQRSEHWRSETLKLAEDGVVPEGHSQITDPLSVLIQRQVDIELAVETIVYPIRERHSKFLGYEQLSSSNNSFYLLLAHAIKSGRETFIAPNGQKIRIADILSYPGKDHHGSLTFPYRVEQASIAILNYLFQSIDVSPELRIIIGAELVTADPNHAAGAATFGWQLLGWQLSRVPDTATFLRWADIAMEVLEREYKHKKWLIWELESFVTLTLHLGKIHHDLNPHIPLEVKSVKFRELQNFIITHRRPYRLAYVLSSEI